MSSPTALAAALRRRLRGEACPVCHLAVALVMPRTVDPGADDLQPAPPPDMPEPGPCPSCGRVLAADVSPIIDVVLSGASRVLHARLRDVVAEQPAAHRSTDALTGRADTKRPYPEPRPGGAEIGAQRPSQTVEPPVVDDLATADLVPIIATAAAVPPAYATGPVARGEAEWTEDDDRPPDQPPPGFRRIHQDAPGWPSWLT